MSEAWFQHEPEQGMCVELHSLSKAELNGQLGECQQWNAEKERWAIRLLDGQEKSILVKLANLRRAPPADEERRHSAFQLSCEATGILSHLRSADGEAKATEDLLRVLDLLSEAEALDFANVAVHQARGDMAMMQGDMPSAIVHFRRAVANGHNLKTEDPNINGRKGQQPGEQQLVRRVALAGALGNHGDLHGEEQQIRMVLAANPGHIHARLHLGGNLSQRGRVDDAIPELLMALQLPNDGPGNTGDAYTVAVMRCSAAQQLASIYGRRASEMSQQREHRAAITQLERLAKMLRDVLQGPLWFTHADRGTAALASHDVAVAASETMAVTFGAGGQPVSQIKQILQVVLDLARTEANMAGDYLELNERAAAEEALERSGAALALHPDAQADSAMQGRLQYERGKCREHEGDAAAQEGSGEAARLYHEAKELYRASHKTWPDAGPQQGFGRVQAKAHPDMEFVQNLPGGGGFARALKPGVQLEAL